MIERMRAHLDSVINNTPETSPYAKNYESYLDDVSALLDLHPSKVVRWMVKNDVQLVKTDSGAFSWTNMPADIVGSHGHYLSEEAALAALQLALIWENFSSENHCEYASYEDAIVSLAHVLKCMGEL